MRRGDERLASELAGCFASHADLVDHLRTLREVRPDRPAGLAGWTVGHVLTHLARNADSYRSLVMGHPQYEGGWEQRNADIDAGASRDWPTLLDDVTSSCAQLEAAFEAVNDWDQPVPLLMGAQPARVLPMARRREVEVHRVDLGLGYSFDDVPGDFVAADLEILRRWWSTVTAGAPEPPGAVTSLSLRDQWRWLLGRLEIDGVTPAGLF